MIEQLENKTGVKKFDICLMNPPYDKNLHLKFLEKVINICNKVVSIQPTPWIQDPVAFTWIYARLSRFASNCLDI